MGLTRNLSAYSPGPTGSLGSRRRGERTRFGGSYARGRGPSDDKYSGTQVEPTRVNRLAARQPGLSGLGIPLSIFAPSELMPRSRSGGKTSNTSTLQSRAHFRHVSSLAQRLAERMRKTFHRLCPRRHGSQASDVRNRPWIPVLRATVHTLSIPRKG